MSVIVMPDGKQSPVLFKNLKVGMAFCYDGDLLQKVHKFDGPGAADAYRFSDGTTFQIPEDALVIPRVVMISTLGTT